MTQGDVYIQFDPWGRMGNRMFQYVFGWILAQERGCNLFHDGLPNFGIAANIKQPEGNIIFTSEYGDHHVDIDNLKKTSNHIVIDSYVQRSEYYLSYRNLIKDHFKCNDLNVINQNKLVLHIRETDYLQTNSFLGYKNYRKIIEECGFTDNLIVTDNSNCDTVQQLVKDGCSLVTEGYVSTFSHVSDTRSMLDFRTLLLSENIALSQSSFSWWAAFLGDHKNVFFPFIQQTSMWKIIPEKDDIDLFFKSTETKKIII